MSVTIKPAAMRAIQSVDADVGRAVLHEFAKYAVAHDQFKIDHKHAPLRAANRSLYQSIVILLGGQHQGSAQLNQCWIASNNPDFIPIMRVPPRSSRLYE